MKIRSPAPWRHQVWRLVVCFALAPSGGDAQTHLVVIGGIGGEAKYRQLFHAWATTMIDAATSRSGLSDREIVYLAEQPERDPARIRAKSTKENIEAAFRELAGRAGPTDQIFVLLIGHGSARGEESRFNLPGPDMGPGDFAGLLDLFPTQPVIFVNTASASGSFVPALSGANRTIITATKSGFERNEALFGGFFVEAFAGEGADTDKDQRVSVLEAFTYARLKVARLYEDEGRLQTEHAVLDDDGDGEATDQPNPSASDGGRARRLFLSAAPSGVRSDTADPMVRALMEQKRDLEQQVEALKGLKASMEPEVYEEELERLLVELALKSRELRERVDK